MSLIRLEYTDVLESDKEKKVLEFSSSLLEESVNRDSLFVIKVDGESMEPVILDRALVVADISQREVEDGGVYLVYNENKMWIKKAKKYADGVYFVSINEAYAHLVYRLDDVRVVAKAVLSFRRF